MLDLRDDEFAPDYPEPVSRTEQKQRTRRAILDAALRLSAEETFAAVSLRRIAKEVGIVPTAFYRHFASIDALGLALVDESFAALRLRDVRRRESVDLPPASPVELVDSALAVLVELVRAQRDHIGFITRERTAGPPAVREEIRHQVERLERELAMDVGRLPATRAWSDEDLRVLAHLVVGAVVTTAEDLIAARPEAEPEIVGRAGTQLRMVLVGAVNWRSSPTTAASLP